MLALDDGESSDAGADKYTCPFRQFGRNRQARVLHRVIGCRDGVMDERIHLLDFFLFKPAEWIEVLNLSGNPCGKLRGVQTRNRRDATASLAQPLPRLFPSDSQRGNQ